MTNLHTTRRITQKPVPCGTCIETLQSDYIDAIIQHMGSRIFEINSAKETGMLRAVIVEDDSSVAAALRRYLISSSKVSVVGCATDGHAGLKLLDETKPDVVFLDISLPKPNGIEIAQALVDSESPPLIVFVTGFPEYATQAFELDAVDFIVKPFDCPRIDKCLQRLESRLPHRLNLVPVLREEVARLAAQHGGFAQRLAAKDLRDGSIHILDIAQIAYIERQDRRVLAFTPADTFTVSSTIKYLEERLAPHGFFRVNIGTLVNLSFIERLHPRGDEGYELVLRDLADKTLSVSRSCAKDLREALRL